MQDIINRGHCHYIDGGRREIYSLHSRSCLERGDRIDADGIYGGMITVGWKYAMVLGSKASYVSMPSLSKRWMYFPVPLAGIAMVIFELESIYNHIKSLYKMKGGAV
jgi:hypothetical protein